jgi:S-adenosylmethionine/arginine decarboxylase-like enzyme
MRSTRKAKKSGSGSWSAAPVATRSAGSWGYHLIINAGLCDPVALRSKETIAKFAKTLVKKIDMVAFGPPRIVRFGEGNKRGTTLVQLIETSCIVAHAVEQTNDIYLDVFSCKYFDPKIAEDVFREFFKPTTVEKIFMNRQAKH